uniref:zona pellucida sperm-binding protein 3d.2 isoform X2 n=1 Tax=Gasterosteus aculeatus aculeatus TaxID=481459 RepID=UPI001A998357|nr:zona pellucida sperm-binding protein 3d.2 isoform X2 [Gasterosteus aculeatus aculeatus]
MIYPLLLFTLPLLSSANGETTTTATTAFKQTPQVMRKVSRSDTPTLPPPYVHLPVFLDSRSPPGTVEKERHRPFRATGRKLRTTEPVLGPLSPARANTSQPAASGVSVKTSCERNKMLVQVRRSILGTGERGSRLKLGTCRPSGSERDYLYFEYDHDMCGTKRTIINNQVAYTNTLRYDPLRLQGPIRRAVPFNLPVSCYFNRYQYSEYTPKMQLSKIFTPMKNRAKFILTPRNALWERLSPSHRYVLGQSMYFEAEALSVSPDKRLYVHFCYATPEKSHTSTPQFPVVQNYGCMVESKENRSRFIPYRRNAVRFSVDAFFFPGMTGKLHMHCSMSVHSSVPTPTSKSCNYNPKTRKWVELYESDQVCTCCDSNCTSAASSVTKIISSRPWTVEPKVTSTAARGRKKVSTTAAAAAAAATTQKEMTEGTMTSQPEDIAAAQIVQVEDTEAEWLLGGEGVAWVEWEGDEEQVTGFAVVEEVEKMEEEEEEEEEEVLEPHTIFEEIFGFDK